MKKVTCRELNGACSTIITGNSADEMGENCRAHVMEMVQKGDEDHKTAMNEMMKMSKDDQMAWYDNFKNNFDSLSDA